MSATARSASLVIGLFLATLAQACGDSHDRTRADGGSDGDAGGRSDGGGGADAGPGGRAGECATNADCAPGSTCIEVRPGIGVCVETTMEATECTGAGMPPDECCDSSECTEGACHLGPVVPFCGGPGFIPHNVCAGDECTTDAGCTNGVCLPAGAFGRPVRTCLFASCEGDSDCTASAGGRCILFFDPCCGLPALHCRYPDGCGSGDDCPSGYCQATGGRTRCEPGAPPCPA